MVQYNDKNIVTYVEYGCGITFYTDASTKNEPINCELENATFRSNEKPQVHRIND